MYPAAILLLLCIASPAAAKADCPAAAPASAAFAVRNEKGEPLQGANLLFTARNWDSTLSQLSDDEGHVTVYCVPAGKEYDVTISHKGYRTAHLAVEAGKNEPHYVVSLASLPPSPGRYVLVRSGEVEVPGVTVRIVNFDGSVQELQTGVDGKALFAPLAGNGDASFEISLSGFTTRQAQISANLKNGPIVFVISPLPPNQPIVHSVAPPNSR